MNTFDFTSVPLVGNIMKLTGIEDGWVVISILLAIFLVIFLVAWISAAGKARSLKKRVAKLEEEITGLNALTTLPPLHENGWEYAQGADPGSSLVFASTKELKRRRERKAAAESASVHGDDGLVPLPAPESVAASAQEKPAGVTSDSAPKHEARPMSASAADSVTAQVHEAIFASVTSGHLKSAEKDTAPQKHASKISAEDLPPIHVEHKAKKAAEKQRPAAKPAAGSDASLSSRIPRL